MSSNTVGYGIGVDTKLSPLIGSDDVASEETGEVEAGSELEVEDVEAVEVEMVEVDAVVVVVGAAEVEEEVVSRVVSFVSLNSSNSSRQS